MDKVNLVHQHLKETQDRKKKWIDIKHQELEFQVRESAFLKISPTRGVVHFVNWGR